MAAISSRASEGGTRSSGATQDVHPLPQEGGSRRRRGGCVRMKPEPSPLALRARSLRSALPQEGGRKAGSALTRESWKWDPQAAVPFLLLLRCSPASPYPFRHGASAKGILSDLLGRDRGHAAPDRLPRAGRDPDGARPPQRLAAPGALSHRRRDRADLQDGGGTGGLG